MSTTLGYYSNRELEMLQEAIRLAAEKKGKLIAQNPTIQQIISILEEFIKDKELVCYGGTAINNILPEEDQFYNREIELPDYDVFSSDAIKDAKELADRYFQLGFVDVEAKAGMHHGTYKVFVNFFQIADITQMDAKIFANLKKDAIRKEGIYYAPPNFLRMAMYTELSRPAGDISRWEKVLKRLLLLNKHYPLKAKNCETDMFKNTLDSLHSKYDMNKVHEIVRDVAVKEGLVFLGGYAITLYSKYMRSRREKFYLQQIPNIDLLSVDPETSAKSMKTLLQEHGIKNIKIVKKEPIGEYLAEHVIITIDGQNIVYIYKPSSCHSYNTVKVGNDIIHVATIDTMLSFFLIFLYTDQPYFDENRILCLSEYLLKVQQRNRLKQKGLLKRFSINCYGEQPTLEEIKNQKAIQHTRLKNKKRSKEYQEWFLRYIPSNKSKSNKSKTRKRKDYEGSIDEMWFDDSTNQIDYIDDSTIAFSRILSNASNNTVSSSSSSKSRSKSKSKSTSLSKTQKRK